MKNPSFPALCLASFLCAAVCLLRPAASSGQDTAPTGGPYDRLLIRNATLIDGTGSPPYGPVDIVIEQRTIAEVRRVTAIDLARGNRRVEAGRVIEGENLYVMPGIIDAHTHMGRAGGFPGEYIPKLWLGHGITTVRVFSDGDEDPAVRIFESQHSERPGIIAPRIVLYPFWRGADPRLWTAEGAREIVREWKQKNRDGIKISGKPGLLPDVLRAIADEARKVGMGVAVHIGQDGVVPMHAVEVAAAGITTIEHHYGYAEASFSDRATQELPSDYNYGDELQRFRATARVWDQADMKRLYGPVLETLLDFSRQGSFTMVPTFSVYEDQTDLSRAKTLPWLEDYTLPSLMNSWKPNAAVHGSFYFEWTSADEAAWGRLFLKWLPWVNEFKNRGGHVAVGSDTGTSYHLFGFGTIRELELMQRAGFLPLEIVRSATQESARALGLDHVGVVRPGYRADLLVLDRNPLEDFKVLYGTGTERAGPDGKTRRQRNLRYTIAGGQVLEAGALLEDVVRMVKQARAQAADRPALPETRPVPGQKQPD